MTNDETDTNTIGDIAGLLMLAKSRLREAEQVAATVPRLRREIKILEKAHATLTAGPTPRRKVGPTLKDAIFDALEASGGRIQFEPGQMLNTIHALTGGKRNSVQVELHRLRTAGRLEVERDSDNKPIAISVVRHPLSVVHQDVGLVAKEG